MPRQQTAYALPLNGGDTVGDDERVDYDAEYRALDLEPGAPPREIADRARLLRQAFDADKVPPGLRARALARAQIVERAAVSLSDYWKDHGAPPPRTPGGEPIALSERFLAALADALGTGDVETRATPPADRQPSHAALPTIRPADAVAVRDSNHPDAPALPRFAALPSVGAGPIAGQQNGVPAEWHHSLSPAGRRPAVTVTASKAVVTMAIVPHPPVNDHRRAAPGRRVGSAARSVLVKLVLVCLVATAVIRVLQYRTEHSELAAVGEPHPAISTGLPGEPSVRWSGLAAPEQPTGAAAPAVGGRLR